MRTKPTLLALALTLTACSGEASTVDRALPGSPSASTSPRATGAAGVAPLPDGPVTAGRYRFAVRDTCDNCPGKPAPRLPELAVTVPEGWDASHEFVSLFPMPGRDETSPNDPALALGWTNYWVGLNSRPCSSVSHQKPDIEVGPTVADFTRAVVAHPTLKVTSPKPVKLGRHTGLFFTLSAPADISRCKEWRPWDPAPYAQGPANIWDLWVMDVDGVRVVIMAEYFPQTPAAIKAELRHMAESIRFVPST